MIGQFAVRNLRYGPQPAGIFMLTVKFCKMSEEATEKSQEEKEDSIQEIEKFIAAEKAINTVKKTKLDWQRFLNFCQEKTSGPFNIKDISALELDKLLSQLFKDIRKKNGGDYEPDTVSSFQKSIQRHINEQKLPINILKDNAFSRSREVLSARRKNLVKKGLGSKPNATRELSDEEEARLFESGEFGHHNPSALQRTLWWFLSIHFGFRARDESRKLCWGDIKLDIDAETQREVLVWTAERGSKTRQGIEGGHRRQFNPKIFATGTDKCPIFYYKIFKSHRPEKANSPESPLYLAINHQGWSKSAIWYKCSPLGKNEIGKLMATAARNTGLSAQNKKISNHSTRKTSISRLLDAGVPENYVMQLSEHKNLQSLSSYKSASLAHQRCMSDTLSRTSPSVNENGTSTIVRHESSFYTQSQTSSALPGNPVDVSQGQSLLFGAKIGSISNCVFNMALPATSLENTAAAATSHSNKRPRIE